MHRVRLRVLATLPATIGTVDLATATVPHHCGRICRGAANLFAGGSMPRPQALTIGLVMVILAHGFAGRRRLSLHLAVAVLALAAVRAMPGDPVRVAVLGAVIVALVAMRDQFPTRPDARRLRLAAQLGAGVLILVVAGSGWDLAVDRAHPRAVGSAMLAGFITTTSERPPVASHFPIDPVLSMLVAAGGVVVLLLAFAAAAPPVPANAAQRSSVTALTWHPGSDSLAPFATRHDKTYAFSPDGRAAVGYRVFFGTALAGGDPVGDPDSADGAIAEFIATCVRNGWRPAVLGASEPMRARWAAHGLRGLVVGDEAIVHPATFSLASRRMRNVRQAVARTRNAGVGVRIGPLDERLAASLRPVLDDWLAGHRERGFAMNLDRILTPREDCLFAVASLPSGEPVAFARFAVCAGGRTLTLDVAPRRRQAPNGVVERLIVEMVAYGATHGAEEVSLNFAGMRAVFESSGPAARIGGFLVRAFDRWIELGPLYRFCAKFQPTWRPRSLLLGSWASLGVVGAAALTAEFGRTAVPQPPAEPADATGPAPATC
ncbi:phosphatidylglycerol lysyltransferase domain-containing protein [Rugosimonospora africana]|nr:phosphatidylglycerol lysyltransferase domain-containing protein [Rugosimonospora africana]